MNLASSLKESISELHQRIESTPYARAIIAGSIDARDYARSLHQFLHVHEALERCLASWPELPCYDPSTMTRSESLRRDLAWWGGTFDDAILAPADQLATVFARWSPLELLGALYVFEGSRMGSMFLARSLSAALDVPASPGRGLDYHVDGIAERPKAWRAFLESLGSLNLSSEESGLVIVGAVTTMSLLYQLYEGLPASESRREIEVLA